MLSYLSCGQMMVTLSPRCTFISTLTRGGEREEGKRDEREREREREVRREERGRGENKNRLKLRLSMVPCIEPLLIIT